MKKIIYQMLVGCYIVAALVLVCACNSQLDIQTRYPFTVETMPVPKKLKVNETAEIRCELKRDGRWEDTEYTIRWFLYDGKGTLKQRMARCCCRMTVTRWRKKRFGCILLRSRTNRAV